MNKLLHFLVYFLCIASFCYSQQRVSGVVIAAEDNLPVIGAAVMVKGNPSVGTATDIDGKFNLSVPEGYKTLVVSYIGMQTQEVSVKERMEIMMQTELRVL